jgi:NTP-dependent ternary conflict system VMAP-like protein
MVPVLPELSSPITVPERDGLVKLLLACDGSPEFWDKTIEELPSDIKHMFKNDRALYTRVSNLVQRCLEVSYGLESLLNRVRSNTARSIQWYELARNAFRLVTRFPEESRFLADQMVDLIELIDPDSRLLNKLPRNLANSFPQAPLNGYQAILRLFQLPDKGVGIRFVQFLAEEYPACRSKLQQCIEDAAKLFRIRLEQYQPSSVAAGGSGRFLLIQLQSVTPDNELFKVYSWLSNRDGDGMEFFSDGGGCAYKLAEAADAIGQLASAVINFVGSELEIELIVKRGIFCHDVTKWEVTVGELKRVLIREIPLVWRCLERIEARRTACARRNQGMSVVQVALAAMREKQQGKSLVNLAGWSDKCVALRERVDDEFESLIDKVIELGQDLDELMDELSPREKGLCVGLGFVPAAETATRDELSAVISRGVPIVIWFREIPAGVKIDAPCIKQLFCKSKIKLAELRRYVWELRKEAVRTGNRNDIRHHITLLYDDYDRIPPPPPNQMPEQATAGSK